MKVIGPTRARRQLGSNLRRLRTKAGKRLTDVPSNVMSSAKLMKIEAGKQNVKLVDVWALCRLYGADERTTELLASLAEAGSEQGWWEDYRDIVPDYLGLYVGYEEDAKAITFYHAEVVLGLFQTEDYARAVVRAGAPDANDEEVERRVAFRMRRQTQVVHRTEPPHITAILGQAALRLEVGSAQIMERQRAHLRELAAEKNFDVRVIPWGAGAHAALRGSFTLLAFDDEEAPFTAYVETLAGARYMEAPSDLLLYRRASQHLIKQSVPIKEYKQ